MHHLRRQIWTRKLDMRRMYRLDGKLAHLLGISVQLGLPNDLRAHKTVSQTGYHNLSSSRTLSSRLQ
jgi:hypothetical protein